MSELTRNKIIKFIIKIHCNSTALSTIKIINQRSVWTEYLVKEDKQGILTETLWNCTLFGAAIGHNVGKP